METARLERSTQKGAPLEARVARAIYAFALAAAVGIWFFAIRAPLWLDETGSWWQISAGFRGIWPRRIDSLCFPAYSYILWLSTKLIGASEIAMRIPSIIAMLGAVYLLYLAARELFDQELALITCVIFAVNPIVIYEALDVRPYAFAVLAANAAILAVIRLRRSDSVWLAVFLGCSAAGVVWFHYLFAALVPALAISLFAIRRHAARAFCRPFCIAAATFALAVLPAVSGILYLLRTGHTHVFEDPPLFGDLLQTLAPGWTPLMLAVTAGIAAVQSRKRIGEQVRFPGWQLVFCGSLALISILILFGISIATPIHLFAPRHRLVAVPGISLCWALALTPFRSRLARVLFCVGLALVTFVSCFASPGSREHGYTWKYALAVAEKNSAADNAPVLVCSDWPESDYGRMPSHPKESVWFAPLTYYKLTAPVIPLPRSLNTEAKSVGGQFLEQAVRNHERFLAMAAGPSFKTLEWLTAQSSKGYSARTLGVYDGVAVVVFAPVRMATITKAFPTTNQHPPAATPPKP